MNIIFLDVDGVLNSIRGAKEAYKINKRPYSGYDYPFDIKCMNNLKKLVEKTNAFLVITSTWRKDDIGKNTLLKELKKYGIDNRVIGYTSIMHKSRGEEIKAYLAGLNKEINYIILDDDCDFDELESHLIKTDYEVGLTEEERDLAIKKLTR